MNQMQECTSLDLGRYSSCIFQTVENIKQGDQVNLFFLGALSHPTKEEYTSLPPTGLD